jgi:hypothetical protein
MREFGGLEAADNFDDIATLNAIFEELIPRSICRRMPGLVELGAAKALFERAENGWLISQLYTINQLSNDTFIVEFKELTKDERKKFISQNQTLWNEFISRIRSQVLIFYFQNPSVIEALGLEFRPPFPGGYNVSQGDWDLLEPVYIRGKIYKDV